jgi:glycosyltransferase involved in cell wall biosynthesis
MSMVAEAPATARGRERAPARVLMLVPNFGPARPLVGGAERQAEKLSLALLERGCQVEVVTPRDDRRWPEREVVNGLTIHRFPITDLSLVIRRGMGLPNALIRRRQIHRGVEEHLGRFDVLHCHLASPHTAFAVDVAVRLGKPVVCKVGCGGRLFDLLTTSQIMRGGRLLSRNMVRKVTRWVAISSEIRRDLTEWGVDPARIVHIPNGVEPVPAEPLEPRGVARRFLYLGRIADNRDHALMVRAFERVLERVPECELAIVGSGALEGRLRALVESLPLGRERVRMVGYGDPGEWLAWAQVVVQPSHWEGMSNTLLEAMSAGRACVATDIPPNREVLDGGRLGLLSPRGDVEAMAAGMLRLATVPGAAAELGAASRRAVHDVCGIGAVADRYIQLYQSF